MSTIWIIAALLVAGAGVVVRDRRRGVERTERHACAGAFVTVPAGQPWDEVVQTAVAEGWAEKDGRLPVNPSGGLKAKGHPVGATGLYQLVEATLQLRGDAGPAQIDGARLALTQNIGGSGATIATHVLGIGL